MSDKRITFRVGKQLAKRLSKAAQSSGRSESDVVREALESHLDTVSPEESCYDLLKRLGVLGCVKGGPRDLSTNPKYFEGFGS